MPHHSAERLTHLAVLLKKERDEDYRLYKELFLRVDTEQRRKNGVTWYPVRITSEELGAGELIHLDIERTTDQDQPHQFSSGRNITLFSNLQEEQREVTGTIKMVTKNTMKVIMHADELPDWCYDGKLGVNIQFDDNSYTAMFEALDEVIGARHNRVAELCDLIEGAEPLKFSESEPAVLSQDLNASQNRAVHKVLQARDIAVIHGPPGTGKTTSLVHAIRLTLQKENQVLVCAPTNSAVDLLTEKLLEQGVDVLRLGHPARISEDLMKSSVDGRVTSSQHFREIKSLRRRAEEYFRLAGKYKRSFGKQEAQQRSALYNEARSCLKEARALEDFIVDELFKTTQVICCTPVTSRHRAMGRKKFHTLFFDEASQALEPMVWIPLLRCQRLILAGDHFQLPPVVKSMEAKAGGLDKTLLDRCIKLDNAVVLLNRQYRMNSIIMGFSNNWFYSNALTADSSVSDHTLINDDSSLASPLEFIDTAGCGFEEIQNAETLSYSNPGETTVLFSHIAKLISDYSQHAGLPSIDIGIIAPYKEQREVLQEQLTASNIDKTRIRSISVRTIDGFQGEERDVIYISLVRSNNAGEIGFLSDLRRMNVAITRARKKLVVIGDSATIGGFPFYKAFLEYCEKNGHYKSGWDYTV
jgi:ATP-dependent RNA/DNA helicase IGHMBP2